MRNAKSTKELIRAALGGENRWEESPNNLPEEYLIGLIERCGASCLEVGDDLAEFSRWGRRWFHFYRPSCPATADLVVELLSHGWRYERLEARYGEAEYDVSTGRNPFAMDYWDRAIKPLRRAMMRTARKFMKLDAENRSKAG